MNGHVWWYVARAGGLVAWWLATMSVLWGLALSTRLIRRKGAPAWFLAVHRFLGGLTVAFTALHIAGLVADSYVHFGAADVLVPFVSSWRPAAVAAGVVAMHLLVAVEMTSLLMRRLPRRLWRAVHLSSFLLFGLATLHAVLSGTDAKSTVLQWAVLLAGSMVLFLVLVRHLPVSSVPGRPPRRSEPKEGRTALGSS